MARALILLLSGWIVWAAAINLPLMPGILTVPESWIWPFCLALACLWLATAIALDTLRGGHRAGVPAAALAALTLALALRLWLLPIGTPASPLALVGVREILTLFAACFAAFAWWAFRKERPA
ncbi:MAG: hypothetical protein KDG89_04030 [Geminicoccaceae bacterium]|nr:hypothetical protein [Geminicoccaceae bacterium]